jgi:hypothetical protein
MVHAMTVAMQWHSKFTSTIVVLCFLHGPYWAVILKTTSSVVGYSPDSNDMSTKRWRIFIVKIHYQETFSAHIADK